MFREEFELDIDDFIEGIIANPHDDSARMVFADFLEEQGDPRAEMIRLQYELAEMSPFDKRRDKLRKRELKLLKEHGCFGKIPPEADLLKSDGYVGGFVDGIQITVTRFLRKQAEIFTQAPVRRVEMRGKSKKFHKLNESPYLGNIAHLTLRGHDASDDNLIKLFTNPNLCNLSTLELYDRSTSYDADYQPLGGGFGATVIEAIANAENLASLKHLRLYAWNAGEEACQKLLDSNVLSGLESLCITFADDVFLRELADSKTFQNLKALEVRGTLSGHGIHSLQSGSSLQQLESLCISCGGSRLGYDAFKISQPLPKLKHITISGGFPGEILTDIISRYRKLETLDLSGNYIANEHVMTLSEDPILSQLDKLRLTANQIGYEGAKALAESPHRRKSTRLYLVSNPVGAKDIEKLKDAYGKTFGNFGKSHLWDLQFDQSEEIARSLQSMLRRIEEL